MRHRPLIVLWKIDGRWHMSHRVAGNIVKCRSRRQLDLLLDWHSDPRHVPDDVAARRRYVEQVRPALRWFCLVYGVPVPSWLEGNGAVDKLPDLERLRRYGPDPLRVREFIPMPEGPGR